MSSLTSFLSEDQFTCSICLDVFTNPVSTPCGHSFCQACITCYWDKPGGKTCFCPICKESFRKRPELHINHTLRDITEQFKLLAEVRPQAETSKEVVGVGESSSDAKPHQPHRKSRQMPGSVMTEMRLRLQHAQSSEEALHPSGRYMHGAEGITHCYNQGIRLQTVNLTPPSHDLIYTALHSDKQVSSPAQRMKKQTFYH